MSGDGRNEHAGRYHLPDALLRRALRGIDLDARDERYLTWAARFLDADTVTWVASLISRARLNGIATMTDAVLDQPTADTAGECPLCGLLLRAEATGCITCGWGRGATRPQGGAS
jgi:hypothetical protein